MTNEEVSALLNVPMSEVDELGEDLGVPANEWTASDVFAADILLDDQEEDEGDDECDNDDDDDDAFEEDEDDDEDD